MNKYSFAYDTHLLNETLYSHDDVRAVIINFLLDNGVTSTDISEHVNTTIVFKSTLDSLAWIKLIDTILIPKLLKMMTDIFYHFVSVKIRNDKTYCEKKKSNPVLERDFNKLVEKVVIERKNKQPLTK
jgi:hypothetical protein